MSFTPHSDQTESRMFPSSTAQSQWPHQYDVSNHNQNLYSAALALNPSSVNSAKHSGYPVLPQYPVLTYTEEEPVRTYVNPKQYHRILKRRQVRALLEEKKRSTSGTQQMRKRQQQTPYQHTSRHIHATKRQRKRGRFVSTNRTGDDDEEEEGEEEEGDEQDTTSAVHVLHQEEQNQEEQREKQQQLWTDHNKEK